MFNTEGKQLALLATKFVYALSVLVDTVSDSAISREEGEVTTSSSHLQQRARSEYFEHDKGDDLYLFVKKFLTWKPEHTSIF